MYGEEKFREIEIESLKDFIGKDYVILIGGGIVMKKVNKVLMDGLKIYINILIEIIEKRLKFSYDRFLLKFMILEEFYDIRFLKY